MTEEERDDFLNEKIICSTRQIVAEDVIEGLAATGLVYDDEDLKKLHADADRYQRHVCAKGRYRCMKRVGPNPGDVKCRQADYAEDNPHRSEYGFKDINPNHSSAALEILVRLGLARREGGEILFDRRLRSGMYVYPADAGEKFIPCNAFIFAFTRSTTNLVRIVPWGLSRYLTKYLTKIEKLGPVLINARDEKTLELTIDEEVGLSSKLEVNKRLKAISDKKRRKENPGEVEATPLSLPECLCLIYGYKLVQCTMNFVHQPTVALQERPGVVKSRGADFRLERDVPFERQVQDVVDAGQLVGVAWRNELGLPVWRQFTEAQQILMADSKYQSLSVDAVSLFGMRPPELLFVRKVGDYLRCFQKFSPAKRKDADGNVLSVSKQLVSKQLLNTGWVDGMEHQIFVRAAAIGFVLDIIGEVESDPRNDDDIRRAEMRTVFMALKHQLAGTFEEFENPTYEEFRPGDDINGEGGVVGGDSGESESDGGTVEDVEGFRGPEWMEEMLVDPWYSDRFLPVPVMDSVKPTSAVRFLIHIVLSLGEFPETEREVFNHVCWREIFVAAGLLDGLRGSSGSTIMSMDIDRILKEYVERQLMYLPSNTKSFDHYVVQAEKVLTSALISDGLASDEIPSCLYTELRKETTDKAKKFVEDLRLNTAYALVRQLRPSQIIPDAEIVAGATKSNPLTDLAFELQQHSFQSEAERHEEKKLAFNLVKRGILQYESGQVGVQSSSVMLVGLPGTGKSFIMKMAAVCAMSRGLQVVVTAEKGSLAQSFGSLHLAKIIPYPVVDKRTSPRRWAELTILRLQQRPELLYLIRITDVMFDDEIGSWSANMFSMVDIVLRWARNRRDMFGGMFLVATMDPDQLPTIEGYPLLVATQIMTCFKCAILKVSVRHQSDP